MISNEDNEGVQITTVLSLSREEGQALLPMMRRFNAACNWLSGIAFTEHLFHRKAHGLRRDSSASGGGGRAASLVR